jgi:hypothetical protein
MSFGRRTVTYASPPRDLPIVGKAAFLSLLDGAEPGELPSAKAKKPVKRRVGVLGRSRVLVGWLA